MEIISKQALRFSENLTLPSVQVIVVRANMSCSHCRQRVSHLLSKMNGLMDYVVDVGKREVTLRGAVTSEATGKKKSCFLSLARLTCGCHRFDAAKEI
ncbi:copper transport protein ATX1-like [Aristolochia californica]|uniref:copper transport protein ATX1-like n=1 Tax=Aristolochia californica TaxID=171875 RepID=UPI0035E227F3